MKFVKDSPNGHRFTDGKRYHTSVISIFRIDYDNFVKIFYSHVTYQARSNTFIMRV